MKIIEVCESYAAAGNITRYYRESGIKNHLIIPLAMHLSIGNIQDDRTEFLRILYQDKDFYYSDALNKILTSLTDETEIRVWSSRKNDDDYMLLLFLCNLLKDKTNKIRVIFASDYNELIYSINAISYHELAEILKCEKLLSKDEIESFSNEWLHLVNINSELRVIENGIVKNKKYADYFDLLLNVLKRKSKCTIANLIADCIVKKIINDAGDLLYLLIIDRMIDLDKIKVIEKGTSHFTDIVQLV